jgi:hypothetical protein
LAEAEEEEEVSVAAESHLAAAVAADLESGVGARPAARAMPRRGAIGWRSVILHTVQSQHLLEGAGRWTFSACGEAVSRSIHRAGQPRPDGTAPQGGTGSRLSARLPSGKARLMPRVPVKKKAKGLRPTTTANSSGWREDKGKISAVNANMSSLVGRLESLVKQPVVDETGMQGKYDYELKWDQPDANNPNADAVIEAVRDQLGLELTLAKRPIDVTVVSQKQQPQRVQVNAFKN